MIPEADASMRLDLGTVQNATDKLKLDYSYGTTDNNGNVLSQKITVPTVGQTSGFVATQNYSYDSLNRITQATETVAGSQSWNQQFEYDRYGNRTSFSQTLGGVTTNTTPSVDAATNRFNAGQGFSYDASGNVVQDTDPMTGHVRSFAFDGENKQREVKDVTNSNHVVGTYFYDGDGRRVKKVTDTEATIFIYDAGGKLVAEYSTAAPPATPQVSYTTTDHLGSPRINTDATGGVIARHDYHPFGEEIFTAQRTTGLNYSADSVRKQFTGYERDPETDLDFAQARMYGNHIGRFASVDPENSGAYEDNPQSWNGYSYVVNNPPKHIDPDGREYLVCDKDRKNCVTYTDEMVKKAMRTLPGGFQETDREGHFDMGDVLDDDGSVIATYERISIDREYQFVYSVAEKSVKKAKVVGVLAGGAVATGACIGTGTCAAVGAAILVGGKVLLKGSLKYSSKITRQMSRRGWSKEQVASTIRNPHTTAKGTTRAGESVTAHINKDGSYVVVKDATQEVIQISDKTRPWNFPTDWKWK